MHTENIWKTTYCIIPTTSIGKGTTSIGKGKTHERSSVNQWIVGFELRKGWIVKGFLGQRNYSLML